MVKVTEETDKATREQTATQKRRRASLVLRETSARMEESASKERPSAESAVMPVVRTCQPAKKNSLGRTITYFTRKHALTLLTWKNKGTAGVICPRCAVFDELLTFVVTMW